jgi:hypothetical protein
MIGERLSFTMSCVIVETNSWFRPRLRNAPGLALLVVAKLSLEASNCGLAQLKGRHRLPPMCPGTLLVALVFQPRPEAILQRSLP